MNRPLSLNRWIYVEGNPANFTDPTGLTPLQLGYIEGRSFGGGVGNGDVAGVEIVYDYATMSRARFEYSGRLGGFLLISWGGTIYTGGVEGFRYDTNKRSTLIKDDYEGPSIGAYLGVPISYLSVGGGYFHNPNWSIKGAFLYMSLGKSPKGLLIESVGFETNYEIDGPIEYYADKDGYINRSKLISDILLGRGSPALGFASSATATFNGARALQIPIALNAAKRYEDFHVQNSYTCPIPYGPQKPTGNLPLTPAYPPPSFPQPPNPFPVPWQTP